MEFGRKNRDDSENEDLRGVIDDLTVENKRLKHLLRSQRSRSTPSTDDHDKLFEVRMHGLPSAKRRELESLLKNFATSVHLDTFSLPSSSVTYTSHQLNSERSSSSNARHQQNHPLQADSGYGSASNSGLAGSMAQSGGGKLPEESHDRNIQNDYPHDIPNTLLPRASLSMSEHAKMKLVVQRLEQLFIGKMATMPAGEHHQPGPQHRGSPLAAEAGGHEDAENSRKGQVEGAREAHMLPPHAKVNFDALDREDRSPDHQSLHNKIKLEQPESSSSGVVSLVSSRPGSPDQRPTRPLDLDIHRAQIVSENISYIHHLGLSWPVFDHDRNDKEQPWIYLNLLISMAQLHTINVTPNFIRRAIRKLSTKFELSRDGNKVRWKGGAEGGALDKADVRPMETNNESPTKASEDPGGQSGRFKAGSSPHAGPSGTPSDGKTKSRLHTSSRKGSRLPHSASLNSNLQMTVPGSRTRARTGTGPRSQSLSAFDYKPIVYQGRKRLHHIDSYLHSPSSYDSLSGDSSRLTRALSRSNLGQKASGEGAATGAITFFNNPFFCSDLGGDKSPVNLKPGKHARPWDALGIAHNPGRSEESLRHHDACYFAPQFAEKPYRPGPDEAEVNFLSSSSSWAGEDETVPRELPVSGVGGVRPEDNFALAVTVVRRPRRASEVTSMERRAPLSGSRIHSRFFYSTQSCDRLDLQPSRLPSPTYVFFTSSSSSDAADMQDLSEVTSSSSSTDEDFPAPPRISPHWTSSSNEPRPGVEDADDSASVDVLEMARPADPEFMSNQPSETVSGNLAATAGASRSTTSTTNEPNQRAGEDRSDRDVDDG